MNINDLSHGFFDPVKLKDYDKPILVIGDNKNLDIIEINGNKYQQIYHNSSFSKKGSLLMAATLALAGSSSGIGNDYTRKRPNINIITEYGLIELKQSKLSRNDREWVIGQFNYNYKKLQ